MIIVLVIEIGLDISDCINIFVDPENITRIIEDRYVGRCIRNCYIIKINSIRRMSECMINQDGPASFGTVSVICEVTAIAYAEGEVITNCTVVNRDKSGMLICNTEVANIMIAPSATLASIRVGQKILVRVGASRYNIGADRIAINAIPYVPVSTPCVYAIKPTADFLSRIANVRTRIQFEEEEARSLRETNEKAWSIFDQLLYAYKDPQEAPPGAAVVDIRTLPFDPKYKYISRDPKLRLSSPSAYAYTSRDDLPAGAQVRADLAPTNVMLILLEDYCAHLRIIREMVATYSTPELLAAHANLWMIFKKSKV